MVRGVFHTYQRSNDWGVIFYSDVDRLVYYTHAAIQSRKRGVVILAAAIMYTHTHMSLKVASVSSMSSFIQDHSSAFARAFNYDKKASGPVFHENFGRAQKMTEKEIRTNLAYVCNNHVEKKICKSVEESRWSFVPYAKSRHPFSPSVSKTAATKLLLRTIRLVNRRNSENKPLYYRHLNPVMQKLSPLEREQLVDHIISTYKLVDFAAAIMYYGSYEKMVLAMDSNTGSEYDIVEVYDKAPDTRYGEMVSIAGREGWLERIFTMDVEEKSDVAAHLSAVTRADVHQIEHFLHFSGLLAAPQG